MLIMLHYHVISYYFTVLYHVILYHFTVLYHFILYYFTMSCHIFTFAIVCAIVNPHSLFSLLNIFVPTFEIGSIYTGCFLNKHLSVSSLHRAINFWTK